MTQNPIKDAALTFRSPEGFEALREALGVEDTPAAREKLDNALKQVARTAT